MSKKLKKSKNDFEITKMLSSLNTTYLEIHREYEMLFWKSYMGDHSVDQAFEKAKIQRENFRSNETLALQVKQCIKKATGKEKERLSQWQWFFTKYQTPEEVKGIYDKIIALEKKILAKQTSRKESYVDPKTKKIVKASRSQMHDIMATNASENIRKACFDALELLAVTVLNEYQELVSLKNDYARGLGYEDFYAYKVKTEENISKKELFSIFNTIYDKTKYAFADLKQMEKNLPGLRKPWNRSFLLSGDFTIESDRYFPFEEALTRWGNSFQRLGIDFKGGILQLDLLERKGKYENGFCHWPDLVHFEGKKRKPGAANFTCNVTYGQVSSAEDGYNTLFHEGGHAAHLLNSEQTETCVNNEYPPASTAWDETQSMFLDSMLSSIEWTTRYAKSNVGETYPFSLFEREVKKLHKLSPLAMNGISSVMMFEKEIYEQKNLTPDKIKKIAQRVYKKYTGNKMASLRLLSIPHIYSWESSCSYHGYGLAQLAVSQWRKYFYEKYGYIVDNPQVGKELKKMWTYGSAKTFADCVKLATGKKLSPNAYLDSITAPLPKILARAEAKIKRMNKVKLISKPIDLKANISMVHGKTVVATNTKNFEDMAHTYALWLKKQKVKSK